MPADAASSKPILKILIYGINFAPELTGVGKYTAEMAAWLAATGHDVRVITAPPYYPEWTVGSGHRGDRYYLSDFCGVRVRRAPLYVPRSPSGLKRLVHLASFALTSLPSVLKQVFWQPDVVWVVQPTLFCTPAALVLARITGAKAWLHIQDFEVNAGFGLGLLKGSWLRRLILSLESCMLRRFDCVSTISDGMAVLAENKGARTPIVRFPNWVDTALVHPIDHVSRFRLELAIPEGAVVLLYSGNMGNKQGLPQLSAAARRLRDHPRIVFVFCGSGSYSEKLQLECEGLSNVRFLPLQPLEDLNELLGMADIHLLPQRLDASDLVMPSKLTGMLASGKPTIATAPRNSSLAQALEGCGLVVPPDDLPVLVETILTLSENPEVRKSLGRRARARAERTLDLDVILGEFESNLLSLCRPTGLPQEAGKFA